MKTTGHHRAAVSGGKGPTTVYERVLHLTLHRQLPAGTLEITWPGGGVTTYEGRVPGPHAEARLLDHAAAKRIAREGSMGLAETYIAGGWETPDLTAVLDMGAAGMKAGGLGDSDGRPSLAHRISHLLTPNTHRGSKRNISYHYDLGNDFYSLWLDPGMTYSSACFDDGCEDLEEAQRAKYDRMLEIADPDTRSRLLEIGCGWGGFAVHAAKAAGCHITGITLSQEQYEHARARVAAEGLEGQVDIELIDYRRVPGVFDRIVSIEMFEAVGERYWPVFFRRLRELLARGGTAALQTITIPEARFESYRSNPDFIQRYIFPGGMLPSPERFVAAAHAARLEPAEPHFFGHSYAETLEAWLERFDAAVDDVRALGFDERFIRMWRFYLAFCRAGFRYDAIDVMQVALR